MHRYFSPNDSYFEACSVLFPPVAVTAVMMPATANNSTILQ